MTQQVVRARAWSVRRLMAAVLAIGMLAAACDKVPLTAPTESTITLFSSATFVPVNGSIEITASVIESAGTAVQNGTLVTFTSTVGTIEPREARTNAGKVTVRLVAGAVSGRAQIRAFSGGAQSEALEVAVGGAAVETLTVVATPTTVPSSGGTVELVATVADTSGNRISGVPVSFSTTAGVLSASSAVSDGNGEARTRLTTSLAADVTAAAGSKTATAKIAVVNAPVLSLTVPTTGVVGTSVTIDVRINSGAQNATALRSASLDFGDGSSQTLSVNAGSATLDQRTAHTYRASGVFQVQLTVVDALGQRATASSAISIAALAPLFATITSSGGTLRPQVPITFTAAATPATDIRSYVWDFGDGTTRSGNPAETHIFERVGRFTVSVTITAVDGRVARGSLEVLLTAP